MPYQAAIRFLLYLDTIPPKFHCFMGFLFGFVGTLTESVVPHTNIGLANLIVGLVALVAAIRAMRREAAEHKRKQAAEDAANKRREMILEAQLRQALDPINRRQEVSERVLKNVRSKQVKMEESVKGLETLGRIWGVRDPVAEPSILIVDDDPSTLKTFAEFFRANLDDPCILQAMTVEEGMKQLEKAPSYVLVDLKLGERTGLELVPHAKAINPNAEVVIVTGWHDQNQLEAAVAMGVQVIDKSDVKGRMEALVKKMRRDFGVPAPSSDAIPVFGTGVIPPGTNGDDSVA